MKKIIFSTVGLFFSLLVLGQGTQVAGSPIYHNTGSVNVGGNFSVPLYVRHVNGKEPGSINIDNLYLNYNSNKPVLVGFGTGTANLYVSGNVGIGTTSPGTLLDVNDNSNQTHRNLVLSGSWASSGTHYNLMSFKATDALSADVFNDTSGEGLKNFHLGLMSDNGYFNSNRFSIIQGGVERLVVDGYANSGNVGIGTTSPNRKLDVNGSFRAKVDDGTASAIDMDYDNGMRRIIALETGGLNARPLKIQSQELHFSNDAITNMVIDTNGKVGIGTTSPGAKFEVENGYSWLNNAGNVYSVIDRGSANRRAALVLATAGNSSEALPSTGVNWAVGLADSDEAGDGSEFYIGTNTSAASAKLWMETDGKVGIGTTTPSEKLELAGNMYLSQPNPSLFWNGNSLQLKPKADVIPVVSIHGSTSYNSRFDMYNAGDNSVNVRLRSAGISYLNGGMVGIGTTSPSERLEVNGNALVSGEIFTTRIEVSTNPGNWPDYVFGKDYSLRSLNEVEEFINTNKHLPEVPSAKEVEANGQDLGDIQATLLKKVEELTLYLIEQNKNQISLKERLEKLEAENVKLKKLLKQ